MEFDHRLLCLSMQSRDGEIHVLDGGLKLCLVDAFATRSGNVSLCPWCQRSHRETGFFFAPYGLEDKVVRRARSDGVQAIFLVPVNQRAPFFQALQQHAAASLEVAADRDGVFKNTQGRQMAKHMLFAVDFGGPDRAAPWCVQGFVRRAPGRIPRPVEAAESEALLAKLSFLATGLPGRCCTFAS